MRMFQVGGAVRDELLGVRSKDIDFTCVLDPTEPKDTFASDPFEVMLANLAWMGFEIFLETPEHLTVRARFPRDGEKFAQYKGLTADFVLARKEGEYSDGRRPDQVTPGTLEDDLARRDFTMNAIAKAPDGTLIDPHNGVKDLRAGIIRAVGDPMERLTEDALRAVRALRFSVTKRYHAKRTETVFSNSTFPLVIEPSLRHAMETEAVLVRIRNLIADERIMSELSTMFRADTLTSLKRLNEFPRLTEAMFSGCVSLDATMKQKGRGL